MFESWGRSWQLVKASWAILQSDKELILFPVISGIVTILITIVMLIPSIAVSITLFSSGVGEGVTEVIGFVGLFIFYLVTYTISIYFNTALVGAALIRMDGGDPTLKDGIGIANSRLSKIIVFAAMSATVGMILRMIQERAGFVGDIVAGIIGIGWNLATFLVIPVLVVQDVSPWQALKESGNLLKKTWGEQITGNWSIGGVFFLAYLLLIVVGVVLGFLVAQISTSAVIGVVVLVVIAMIIIGVVQGALSGIYQAALYRYAETGVTPDNFDINLIQGAFKPKNKNKR